MYECKQKLREYFMSNKEFNILQCETIWDDTAIAWVRVGKIEQKLKKRIIESEKKVSIYNTIIHVDHFVYITCDEKTLVRFNIIDDIKDFHWIL